MQRWLRILIGLVATGLPAVRLAAAAPPAPAAPPLTLADGDRILVLAPHPDDEVIATGGVLQEAVRRHLPVQVVFFTYGDNNQWSFLVYRKHPVLMPSSAQFMGLVRHDEALAADRALGLSTNDLLFLGYPDFGTLAIWQEHWGEQRALRSMLTRVRKVTYPNAYRPGAPFKGEEILADLEAVLHAFRPTKVFVSHPADHNPDHRALYLFTRVALWDLAPEMQPALFPFLVHYRRWPQPRTRQPEAVLVPPQELARAVDWSTYPLDAQQVHRKGVAMRAHASQYAYSAVYLDSFVRRNELFGDFPETALARAAATNDLSLDASEGAQDMDEELSEEERAAFIGIERRTVALDGDRLVLTLGFSRPFANAVQAAVHVFGYRAGVSFAAMPKLAIRLTELGARVYDQDHELPAGTVTVERRLSELRISVSLAALGQPDHVFTSARTFLGDVPLDWVSWRVLVVGGSGGARGADEH